MTRRKRKPFALWMTLAALIFLAAGPVLFLHLNGNHNAADLTLPAGLEYQGLLRLWEVSYVPAGKSTFATWLIRYIRAFEREYPGIYVELRTLPPERLQMYLTDGTHQDFLPDMLSIDPYGQMVSDSTWQDLTDLVDPALLSGIRPAALERVQSDGRLIGIPSMMGLYALYIHNNLVEYLPEGMGAHEAAPLTLADLDAFVRKASYDQKSGRRILQFRGFSAYDLPFGTPLLGMIYTELGNSIEDPLASQLLTWHRAETLLPADWHRLSFEQAFRAFAEEKRFGILLGGTQVLYGLKRLQEAGKGFAYTLLPIPMEGKDGLYTDQIAAYGLLKRTSAEKAAACAAFLQGMLDETVQRSLSDIGMFSVLNSVGDLYDPDHPLYALEACLQQPILGPSARRRNDALRVLEAFEAALLD